MKDQIRELAESALRQSMVHNGIYRPSGFANFVSKEFADRFAELIINRCGYHADIFAAAGCPVDMDETETKPSDYIKKQLGI